MTPRHQSRGTPARAVAASFALLAALLAGCASTDEEASNEALAALTREGPATTAPPAATATTAVPPRECREGIDDTRSFRPSDPPPAPGAMPPGSRMAAIFERGHLRVGVDETTLFFSARNPDTGRMEGFEADLAREVARAIFGDGPDLDSRIKFVTVTTEQKFDVVENDDVDMTISVATMSCSRWKAGYDFSSPYYQAFQQLMVPRGSPITSQADLPGKRVCVTSPSSSQTLLEGLNEQAGSDEIVVVKVPTRPKCLIKLQDGKVDAIVLPSSIVAGLLHQDPTMRGLAPGINDASGALSTNTYGVVTNPAHPDLLRFVNALLVQWQADGTLVQLQIDNDLQPQALPPPQYRD